MYDSMYLENAWQSRFRRCDRQALSLDLHRNVSCPVPVRSCSWETKPSRNGDDPVCDLYKRPVQDDGESRPVIFLQERRERGLIAMIGLGESPISGRRMNLGKLVAAATKVFQIPDSGGTKGCVEKVEFVSHEAVNSKVPMG